MRLFLLLSFLILISCNGGGGSSSSGGSEHKVVSGDIVEKQKAQEFIKQTSKKIPESLQIQNQELSAWEKEGLITQEESLEISQNL